MNENSRASLGEYLKEVTDELRRREGKVTQLTLELEELTYKLECSRTPSHLLSGDAGLIVQGELFRKALMEKIEATARILDEAKREVKLALERKAQVEADLEQIEQE